MEILRRLGNTKFYRVSNGDGKTWCFPTENLRMGMELYQPSGCKGILLKRVFPYLHRSTIIRRIAGAELVIGGVDNEILRVVAENFGEENIGCSIFGGTPSVHQKITIQFFKGRRILGYGKVADSQVIADLFAHERSLLGYLRTKGITGIPECLYCNQLPSGLYFFLQSTTKCRGAYSPAEWTPLHEAFLSDLAARTAVEVPFPGSDFYWSLSALQRFVPSLPPKFGDIISGALAETFADFGSGAYKFSAFHADFTPWNMFVSDKRLFVFDWEYGQMTYPPMLDRYHFHVQQYIHVKHLPAAEIYGKMRGNEWFDDKMFRCYLLDVISRFVCRENGNISDSLSGMLAIWAGLLALMK